MPAAIQPWSVSNIPSEITAELNSRKINRSFNYINNATADWSTNGDHLKYRGPRTSWIRLCSNGRGKPSRNVNVYDVDYGNQEFNRQRFVLYGGKGFYQTYGFSPPTNPNSAILQVIGYTPGNKDGSGIIPHTIENSLTNSGKEGNYPIHVPSPEISRIEVTIQKELYRRVQIEWVCFSWKQLEYMTPYFLVPGISCMVEWGWNHYNPNSLVNLGDTHYMRQLWDNAYPLYTKNIIDSCGNYDVCYGIITNFNWSIENNKIICTTEITSKDRLYAGISKNIGLSVNETSTDPKGNSKPGIFRSIRDFFNNDNNAKNLQRIVTPGPITDENNLVNVLKRADPLVPNDIQNTWYDILSPLLTEGTTSQKGMRAPWIFGYFSGRPNDNTDPLNNYKNWGDPQNGDLDKGTNNNDSLDKIWINMGMVVTLLNYFSALPSGGRPANNNNTDVFGNNEGTFAKKMNMFYVDIQNSVIAGHPNLVSCDPKVLIPNSKAPKFLYGSVGLSDYGNIDQKNKDHPYANQYVIPLPFNIKTSSKPDIALQKTCFQSGPPGSGIASVYRNDLDRIINYNRYRFAQNVLKTNIQFLTNTYAFPSKEDILLPQTISGLNENQVKGDGYSGLLSNIYISYQCLKDVVNENDNHSYYDIYNHIFDILKSASNGFWDLSLVDVEGIFTITDKNYVGDYSFKLQGDPVYSFDYYDADSLLKSLKFRPVLSDAQATRVIYGNVNNPNAKYSNLDKDDLLNYEFKDAVIQASNPYGDPQGELNNRKTAQEQQKELLRTVQQVNTDSNDHSLQMSLNPYGPYSTNPTNIGQNEKKEIVKLVLPTPELLTQLINDGDDGDDGKNSRYCAVQPGIILEITLEGIGGLRTFQYFLVKNLPEPYSEKNIIWRITEVHQTLEVGNWETTIKAQPLPLRGYIKKQVVGPLGNNAKNNGWPD